VEVEPVEVALAQDRLRALVVGAEERRRRVQAEERERVLAGRDDRRVGERVAVELGGRRVGQRAAGRRRVRGLEVAHVLVEAERAGERVLRADARAQRGQPVEQQVDLRLAAGRDLRHGRPRSCARTAGATFASTWPADTVCSPSASRQVTDPPSTWTTSAPVRSSAPASRAAPTSAPDSAPMPPTGTRHGTADQVVQQAAVLHERRVVERGERADEPVRGDDALLERVGEALAQHLAERALDHVAPRLLAGQPPRLLARGQRCEQRREQPLGEAVGHRVEAPPRLRRRPVVLDEQPGRRVRGDASRRQAQRDAEVARDRLREEADEVRVAREQRVVPRERPLGDRRAAQRVAALEHEHAAPGAREVRRGDQPVVSPAGDDDVDHRRSVGACAAPQAASRVPLWVSSCCGTRSAAPSTRTAVPTVA
jgi:hypothetical protein